MIDHHHDRTILLVEDEAIIALANERLLRKHGYAVVCEATGEAALERVAEDPSIDLILMDIDLGPGIDGTEAATHILQHQSVPIVFLTGHAEKEMVDRVKGITRYGYILKSAGEFVLLESITMAFEMFETNRELERSRDHYQTVVRLSGEIVVQHAADQRWVFVNQVACEFWGRSEEELLNDGYLSFVHPDDQEATLEALTTMMERREPIWGLVNRQLTPRGWRDVEWNSAPLVDHAGAFVGHQATGRDVTERLRTAERSSQDPVHRALHQFRTVYDSAPMGIILADDDNRIVETNATAQHLLGYAAGELIGRNGRELIHPDDLAETPIEHVTESVLALSERPSIEHRFLRNDGTYFHASAWIGRIEIPGSRVSHMIQFQDISARKNAEQRVATLLAEKELLLREVHHRVKNNLAVVAAILAHQEGHDTTNAEQSTLREAASRIRTMQSLYERAFESEDYAEVALAPYLEKLVRDAHEALGMREHVLLGIDVEDLRLPFNVVFPLGIIAKELITNAARHAFREEARNPAPRPMPNHPTEQRVSLSVRRLDGSIEMCYRDNGVGIPDEVIDGPNHGFGLTLIDLLSRQLEGEYRLRQDGGTEVRIVFPAPTPADV